MRRTLFASVVLFTLVGFAPAADDPAKFGYTLQLIRAKQPDTPKKHAAGDKITLEANVSGKHGIFQGWFAGASAATAFPVDRTALLADPKAPATTLVMPAENLVVFAVYRPFVHPLFGDHMVVQRRMPVPVWGWAATGQQVTVALNGQSVKVAAGADGRWQATLKPMEAGGPFEMTIAAAKKQVIKDVMVGEVWVCTGQSNMHLPLTAKQRPNDDAPNVRVLNLAPTNQIGPESPLDSLSACTFEPRWDIATRPNLARCSATGYWFARQLSDQLKVPVGIVVAALNGSPIEAWISKKTLLTRPAYVQDGKFSVFWKLEPSRWQDPYVRYNGWIHPLAPLAFRGFVWYQGETNARRNPSDYHTLLPLMIQDWRACWADRPIPFICIEMPWTQGNATNLVREAQVQSLATVKSYTVVGVMDVGDLALHPENKKAIGARAAQAARGLALGEKIEFMGPIYHGMKLEGERVRLQFDHLGSGLISRDGKPLRYFHIAGHDRKFVPAQAIIEGKEVLVSSPKVKIPAAVRYGWHDLKKDGWNFANKEGLAAPTFRTDAWPVGK